MVFFAVAIIFPVLPIVLGRFLRPIKYEKNKMRPYECGIDPTTEAHERFTVRYYIVAMLFLIFDAFQRDIYANPDWLWLFPIIIFLWIGRVWLVSQRGELNDDPVVFALKDRQSLVLGVLMAAAFVLAWLGAPL